MKPFLQQQHGELAMKIFYFLFFAVTTFYIPLAYSDTPDLLFTDSITIDSFPIALEKSYGLDILRNHKTYVMGKQVLKLNDDLNLSGKNLRNIQINRCFGELKNIIFDDCDLSGANLRETVFVNCSFKNSNLAGCWIGTIKPDCDFTDAWIGGIEKGCQYLSISKNQLLSTGSYKNNMLTNIFFTGSDFTGVDFSGCTLKGTSFYCQLNHCIFINSDIEGVCFGADIEVVQLLSTKNFREGLLKDVKFHRVIWSDDVIDMSRMSIIDCEFGSPRPKRDRVPPAKIDLTDSVISGCNFEYFRGLTIENVKSTWNYKYNRMEGIKLPKEIQDALDAEKTNEKP